MYLQCWCVGVWYKCKLFSMQCVNRELITFACTWAIRMHIKVQSEYVQAQFQSGCWAINWIYGLFIDLVCWIVCVEYHISYGGQSCYIDFFFPSKSLAFAVSQRILSSSIWTSDVLSFITINLTSSSGITHAVFEPHIQNLPIPCANLSTSLHLEARNHAIHPAHPFSPSEVFVFTGICVSRLAQWINVWQCSMVRKTGSACVGGK